MRLALTLGLVLAATTAARDGCGPASSGGHAPCDGKPCGAQCSLCPPDARNCVETADPKACDAAGRCVSPPVELGCPSPAEACAGKACGDGCLVSLPCHFVDPPCSAPESPGRCDVTGACVAGDPGSCSPHPDCAGKACGASCNPCGPERTCPTLVASACDRYGRCVGNVPPVACPPPGGPGP